MKETWRVVQWWFLYMVVLGAGFIVGYMMIKRGMGN